MTLYRIVLIVLLLLQYNRRNIVEAGGRYLDLGSDWEDEP